ncbi:MAG TPA: phosphoribosylformylglycinamidine synthase subunit PurQ [Candidatus Hydrogenedentes bacterium]|nr:phosphoribosylformylglycinamidine synthase subunit PurQ [Candidatus Hydrogenedentota bacterium]HNT88868.1 phosphoribosylformylglycinamidine synthase subunit PurQ [Candidatus Hydrogenedentota bacterium]
MVRALIVTGFGINCEHETAHAFHLAGAETAFVHLNDLVADPARLHEFHILAVPGGFSFGDDVASGKILANRLRFKLGEPIAEFLAAGKLAIGICNGFQVMVKMGILPLFNGAFRQEVTVTHNDSGRFEDRWVRLTADPGTRCVWSQGITGLELPIRHGEGKFIPRDDAVLERLRANGQVVFRYAGPDGAPARGAYPANPNGAVDDIAGICDPSGRVLGLMPHPEAFVARTQHPRWTREEFPEEGAGLQVFRNAVGHLG